MVSTDGHMDIGSLNKKIVACRNCIKESAIVKIDKNIACYYYLFIHYSFD